MNASEKARESLIDSRVTIYFRGEMMGNIHKLDVRAYSVALRPWAQYASAVETRFIKKGSRRTIGFIQSYQPSLVILEGWGHPDPAGIWNAPVVGHVGEGDSRAEVTTTTGRHLSCSAEWSNEFDALLAAHVEATGAKILHDFRGHDPYGRIEEVRAA